MHLLIPFAAPPSDAALAALGTLALSNLARLLARWTEVERDVGDAGLLSPPHERALARAWGWTAADGLLPLAAVAAAADGIEVGSADTGWALLSPTHWQTSTDQVALLDPDELVLNEPASRALLDALRPLFADDGWALHWGAATRWYAAHASLRDLPTASLDRVVGRSVVPWLDRRVEVRRLRRLQAEAQMLLHTHPLNAEREARGALPVNSFWISGTGTTSLPEVARRQAVQVEHTLRRPALADDIAAWVAGWQLLDAGPLRTLLDAGAADPCARLTLCGERTAVTWAPRAGPAWRRWFGAAKPDVGTVLAEL